MQQERRRKQTIKDEISEKLNELDGDLERKLKIAAIVRRIIAEYAA